MEVDKPNEPLYLLSSSQIIHEYLNLWKHRVNERGGDWVCVCVCVSVCVCTLYFRTTEGSEVSKQQTDDVEDDFKQIYY